MNAKAGASALSDLFGPDADATFVVGPAHLAADGAVEPALLTAFAARVAAAAAGPGTAMVTLNCDVVSRPGAGARVEGRAEIARRTRSLVFLNGRLSVGGEAVLSVNGVWKVLAG